MDYNGFSKVALFRSDKSSMSEVEPLLGDLKQRVEIPDDRFYNLLIAVTEAFNNAIVHGNKLNPDKIVEVKITTNDKCIRIVIKDEGKGFDPDKVADPREPENLLKENGRGVFLIRSLIDEVHYSTTTQGTTIEMVFNL